MNYKLCYCVCGGVWWSVMNILQVFHLISQTLTFFPCVKSVFFNKRCKLLTSFRWIKYAYITASIVLWLALMDKTKDYKIGMCCCYQPEENYIYRAEGEVIIFFWGLIKLMSTYVKFDKCFIIWIIMQITISRSNSFSTTASYQFCYCFSTSRQKAPYLF